MSLNPVDQRQLERKSRELRSLEDKLNRMEQQVRRNDELVRERAREVEDRGREFVAKERNLRDELAEVEKKSRLLDDDRQALNTEKEAYESGSKARLMIMLPILLVAAIGTGYLVFEFRAKDNFFYDQFKAASLNIEKLNAAYGDLDQQKMRVEELLAEEKKVVDDLRQDLAKQTTALESVTSGKRSLQLKYDDAINRVVLLEGIKKELTADKERLRDELGRLISEKELVMQDVVSLEMKLNLLGAQLLAEQDKSSQQGAELTATAANLEDSRSLNNQLQKELEALVERAAAQKTELEAASGLNAAKDAELQQKTKTIADQNEQLVSLKKDIQSKLDVIKAKDALLAELQGRADSLMATRTGLQTEAQNLQSSLQQQADARAQAEAQLSALKQELMQLTALRDTLLSEKQALQNSAQEMIAQNQALKSQLESLEKELQAGVEALQ
jgi:chromosome segregation ATPase